MAADGHVRLRVLFDYKAAEDGAWLSHRGHAAAVAAAAAALLLRVPR